MLSAYMLLTIALISVSIYRDAGLVNVLYALFWPVALPCFVALTVAHARYVANVRDAVRSIPTYQGEGNRD